MRYLSLDCSTRKCSLVFSEKEQVVHQHEWTVEQSRHETIVEILSAAQKVIGWSWSELDGFIVGRGPGAYSGMRASLLAVQAIAAPSKTPVMAISGMDALGWEIMEQKNLLTLTILGDARRQAVWCGHIFSETIVLAPVDWQIIPMEKLAETLHPERLLLTPHWEELATLRANLSAKLWLPGPYFPNAITNARLALERQRRGIPPEPLLPLYLHPAA